MMNLRSVGALLAISAALSCATAINDGTVPGPRQPAPARALTAAVAPAWRRGRCPGGGRHGSNKRGQPGSAGKGAAADASSGGSSRAAAARAAAARHRWQRQRGQRQRRHGRRRWLALGWQSWN